MTLDVWLLKCMKKKSVSRTLHQMLINTRFLLRNPFFENFHESFQVGNVVFPLLWVIKSKIHIYIDTESFMLYLKMCNWLLKTCKPQNFATDSKRHIIKHFENFQKPFYSIISLCNKKCKTVTPIQSPLYLCMNLYTSSRLCKQLQHFENIQKSFRDGNIFLFLLCVFMRAKQLHWYRICHIIS